MTGSVLETFWILFDSDAAKVKKGAEEAERSTAGLNQSLAATEEISATLGSSFLAMATQAAGALSALFAVQRVVGGAFSNAEFAKHIGETAEALGLSARGLGAWSDAIKHIGGSAEGAVDSIRALSGSLAQVDATGHSRVKPFFDELKINMKDAQGNTKNVTQLLWELSGAFEHMSKQESFGFGRKMQLDEGMIRLLQRGQAGLVGIIDQMHKLGDIQDDDVKAAQQWDEALDNAEHRARTFGLSITTELLPKLADLSDWFGENGPLIISTIEGVTAALATMAIGPGLLKLGAVILSAVADFGLLQTALIGLEWTGAALAGILSLPIAAVVALGAAFTVLIYHWEDIYGEIKSDVLWLIKAFGDLGNWVSRLFGGSNAFNLQSNSDVNHTLSIAQQRLATANSTPLGAQTSNSINNSARSFSSENHLHIENITIQTQATSADDVAKHIMPAVKEEFNKHFRQTVNDSDDGQAI